MKQIVVRSNALLIIGNAHQAIAFNLINDAMECAPTAGTFQTKLAVHRVILMVLIARQINSRATTPFVSMQTINVTEVIKKLTKLTKLNLFNNYEENDCGDKSDETLRHCIDFNCTRENHRFRCKNGLCIRADQVCNAFNDCDDGSGKHKQYS